MAIIIALALLFGGVGYVMIDRAARHRGARRAHDKAFRESQDEFVETLQAMRNEIEAHALLKEHLERSLDDAEVTVLNRNNSDDRLEPATVVPLERRSPSACSTPAPTPAWRSASPAATSRAPAATR